MRYYKGKGARVILDIVREATPEQISTTDETPVTCAIDIAARFRTLQDLGKIPKEREAVVMIALDAKNRILAWHVASVGTLNASPVHPREIFRPAITIGAASIALAHNHPSGDTTPSSCDVAVTERIRQSGELLGIDLLDHIIVGADSYYSFAENSKV
jgi:DNA repair protein RadC